MNTFLPDNYEIPEKPSNYMKFKQGINRFRILTPAVLGYEYWNLENKPVRSKKRWEEIPSDIKLTPTGVPTDIKHFWAFVVWNYNEKAIQILQITQTSIMGAIKLGVALRDGNATNNDIGVTRSGEKLDTTYDVQFADPTPIKPEIEEAFKARKINLEALFTGDDPFSGENPTPRGEDPNLTVREDIAEIGSEFLPPSDEEIPF